MNKIRLILGIALIIISVFIFINIFYYPPLPIDNLSAKEVIRKMEKSDSKLVEIAVEDDSIWYITNGNEGIAVADENIKQMLSSIGWEFKEKEGSGLFFEKDGERLIATTQKWSKKYVLVKVQDKYKKK